MHVVVQDTISNHLYDYRFYNWSIWGILYYFIAKVYLWIGRKLIILKWSILPWRPKRVPFHLNGLLGKEVVKDMNVMEIPLMVEVNTMYNQKTKNVSYYFNQSPHGLCLDREDMMIAQIHPCKTF